MIAIIASLAVFGASSTPAVAASYTPQENKFWKSMKRVEPRFSMIMGKKETVNVGKTMCLMFDIYGTDNGFQVWNQLMVETFEDENYPPAVVENAQEYSVKAARASTRTICKKHKKDLRKTLADQRN